MATGKNIKDVGVGRVRGSMKIPVGGAGNAAITPKMLQDSFNQQSNIYITDNPAIARLNGLTQDLRLNKNGVLTFDGTPAQSVFLRVSGNFTLDISGFRNVNNYVRNPEKNSFISIINWNGMLLLYGIDYNGSHIDPIDPTNPPISCEGAIDTVNLTVKMDRSEFNSTFTIYDATTDEVITQSFGYYYMDGEDFKARLNLSDEWLSRIEIVSTSPTEYPTDEFSLTGHIQIRVLDGNPLRIKVEAVSPYGVNPERTRITVDSPINPTLVWNTQDPILGNYNASICLAKNLIPLGCEGAITTGAVFFNGVDSFGVRVFVNETLLIETATNLSSEFEAISTALQGVGVLYDPDAETLVNTNTEYTKVVFQTGVWSNDPDTYFSGVGIGDTTNPTVRAKIPTEDGTGQVDYPNLDLSFYSEVSYCFAPVPEVPLGCEGAINSFKGQFLTDGGLYGITVDGVGVGTGRIFRDDVVKNQLAAKGVILNAYDGSGNLVVNDGFGHYNGAEIGEFINLSANYIQVRIELVDASAIDTFLDPVNPSAVWDSATGTLTFCLAPYPTGPVDSHCYLFTQEEIDSITNQGQTTMFLNNSANASGIETFAPSQFYITANGEPVDVYAGGGGASWGTDTDPNILIGDADGWLRIVNKQNVEMVVRICSRVPIDSALSPVYQPALSSTNGNMVFHRDVDGFETCIIKLAPTG